MLFSVIADRIEPGFYLNYRTVDLSVLDRIFLGIEKSQSCGAYEFQCNIYSNYRARGYCRLLWVNGPDGTIHPQQAAVYPKTPWILIPAEAFPLISCTNCYLVKLVVRSLVDLRKYWNSRVIFCLRNILCLRNIYLRHLLTLRTKSSLFLRYPNSISITENNFYNMFRQ